MTILDEIVDYKKKEVADCKTIMPFAELEKTDAFHRNPYSLSSFVKDPGKTGIIAEFKRQSPSKGVINDKVQVEDVTQGYAKAGASALSVLTDFNFFGGSVDDLIKARGVNKIPVLRKEFIIDEYQIVEAKSVGADAILLIAACLTVEETKQFAKFARDLEMEVLLELHDFEELDHINEFVNVVGVNNRDLKTFKVDLEHSVKLAKNIPNDFVKISESGIKSIDDINFLKSEGFEGFLIGESFMKEENPAYAFSQFIEPLTH